MEQVSANTLIASAALAATDGAQFDLQAVRTALAWGLRAARLGRGVPLPVLLDGCAVFRSPRRATASLRGQSQRPPEAMAYDEWLRGLGQVVRRERREHRAPAAPDQVDALPMLLAAWPAQPAEDARILQWAAAYGVLTNRQDAFDRILTAWQGRRDLVPARWAAIYPVVTSNKSGPVDRDRMWSAFSSHGPAELLHEMFDHAAAHLYLDAEDPEVQPDQLARIRTLLRQSRHRISSPFTDSYDDQDPYHGATALATLALKQYGKFKIVNGSHPRLSRPPTTPTPRPARIHLCWANGYTGLAHKQGSRPPCDIAEASTLQAIVALLLDDWRNALRKLSVEFFIHRGEMCMPAGGGGARWKTALKDDTMPPGHLISQLLARRTWDSLGNDLGWSALAWPADVWCLCLLDVDMPEFGFQLRDHEARTAGPVWAADAEALPDCISHVILVQPSDGVSSICRVMRRGGDLALRPLRQWRRMPAAPTPFYWALRTQALDIVLERLKDELR